MMYFTGPVKLSGTRAKRKWGGERKATFAMRKMAVHELIAILNVTTGWTGVVNFQEFKWCH